MTRPRIEHTVEGPVVVIPGEAVGLVKAALGRLLAERPSDVPRDPVLLPLAHLCDDVERMRARGAGYVDGTDEGSVVREWVSPATVANLLGVGPPAVRKQIRQGLIAAEKIDGRWWIPADAVPEPEDEDEREAA